jgi:hypothetical protein
MTGLPWSPCCPPWPPVSSSWPVNIIYPCAFSTWNGPSTDAALCPCAAASLVDPDAAWLLSANDPNYNYTPANQLDLKLAFVADVLYFTVVGAAKVSLLLMYTRIFSVSTNFLAQVWVLGAAVAAFWATGTIGTLFNCWPIYWSWLNSLSPAEHCINYNIFWLVTGIIEEILDICVLALPVRHIMKLQLSLQKKVGVASIFLLGGL